MDNGDGSEASIRHLLFPSAFRQAFPFHIFTDQRIDTAMRLEQATQKDFEAIIDFYTKTFCFTTDWDGIQPNVEMTLGDMRIILLPRDAFEQHRQTTSFSVTNYQFLGGKDMCRATLLHRYIRKSSLCRQQEEISCIYIF